MTLDLRRPVSKGDQNYDLKKTETPNYDMKMDSRERWAAEKKQNETAL